MTEMDKLKNLLSTARIPFEMQLIFDTPQICYPTCEECICDAICHHWSYGHEEGLLEIMGLTENDDEVEGWLTAEEVFKRMEKHYKENNK